MERLKQKVASSSSRVIASIQQAAAATGSFQPGPASELDQPAGSSLMNADATAHLTDREREILLEVFKKEEQFQRDTFK